MIVKKENEGVKILLNNQEIYFDTKSPYKDKVNFYSQLNKFENIDKIFSLPGEYEIENIHFQVFRNNKSLVIVGFFSNVKFIYLTEDLKEENLKNIYQNFGDIEIVILNGKVNNIKDIKNKFNFIILIDINGKNNLKSEKVKEVKINVKKLEEKYFTLG